MPVDSPPTLSEVQQALTNMILTIQKVNGYSYDLPADHVYQISNQQKLTSEDPQDFPKIIFTLVSGQNQKGASRQFIRGRRWAVTVMLLEEALNDPSNPPVGWKSVADQARDLVQDIEKAALLDSTLGEIVDNIDPTDFETDADNAFPKAIVVFYFDVSYRRHG